MAIQWNDVRADFNDANSAMGNAQRGLSQAGTVFGELRKSILDEEQRAVENEYRQKVFDENVRQFGLQYGLDQDRFAEQKRAALADEDYKDRSLEEQIRATKAQEQHNAASLGLQQQQFNYQKNLDNKERMAVAAAIKAFNNADELNKQVTSLNTQISDTNKQITAIDSMPDLLFKATYGKDVTKDSIKQGLKTKLTDLNGQLTSLGQDALLATTATGIASMVENAYYGAGGNGSFRGLSQLNNQATYEREDAKTKRATAAKLAEDDKKFDSEIIDKLMKTYENMSPNDLASAMNIYGYLREKENLHGSEAFNKLVSTIQEKGRLGKIWAAIANNSDYTFSDATKLIERGESLSNYPSVSTPERSALEDFMNATGYGKTKPINILNPATGTQALEYMLGNSGFTLPSEDSLRNSLKDLNRYSIFWNNIK